MGPRTCVREREMASAKEVRSSDLIPEGTWGEEFEDGDTGKSERDVADVP